MRTFPYQQRKRQIASPYFEYSPQRYLLIGIELRPNVKNHKDERYGCKWKSNHSTNAQEDCYPNKEHVHKIGDAVLKDVLREFFLINKRTREKRKQRKQQKVY